MSHIVIAEDHDDIRGLLVRLFERQGWRVTATDHGDEALRACLDGGVALAVLDVGLPGDLDGIDVVRELRAHPATRSLPVLLLTAKVSRRDVRVGLAAGANAYLTKPFAPAEVLRVVTGLLSNPGEDTASIEP